MRKAFAFIRKHQGEFPVVVMSAVSRQAFSGTSGQAAQIRSGGRHHLLAVLAGLGYFAAIQDVYSRRSLAGRWPTPMRLTFSTFGLTIECGQRPCRQ